MSEHEDLNVDSVEDTDTLMVEEDILNEEAVEDVLDAETVDNHEKEDENS